MLLEKRVSARLFDILLTAAAIILTISLFRLRKSHDGLAAAWRYHIELKRELDKNDFNHLVALRGDVARIKDTLDRQGIES